MFLRSINSQWAATVYVAATSLFLAFILGRYLGPKGFGIYSYIHSLVLIYAVIQDAGFRTIVFRESVTKSQNKWTVDEFLSHGLGHLILTTLGGVVIICLLPLHHKAAIIAGIICYAGVVITSLISSHLKGKGDFTKEAWWQIIVRTLVVIFVGFGIILFNVSVAGVFALWGMAIGLAIILTPFRKLLARPRLKMDTKIYRVLIYFLVIDAATVIYFRVDMVLLEKLGVNQIEIGNYAAAFRLMSGAILFMTPVAHICFRSLRKEVKNRKKFSYRLAVMMILSCIAGAIILICGLFISEKLITFTFGSEYTQAAYLLKYLLIALVFILPNYILTQAMIACEKEKFYAICSVFGALVNILLNMLLIPENGAVGAAMATIITEACLLLGLGTYLIRWFKTEGVCKV